MLARAVMTRCCGPVAWSRLRHSASVPQHPETSCLAGDGFLERHFWSGSQRHRTVHVLPVAPARLGQGTPCGRALCGRERHQATARESRRARDGLAEAVSLPSVLLSGGQGVRSALSPQHPPGREKPELRWRGDGQAWCVRSEKRAGPVSCHPGFLASWHRSPYVDLPSTPQPQVQHPRQRPDEAAFVPLSPAHWGWPRAATVPSPPRLVPGRGGVASRLGCWPR
mmetsp:Transcript_72728/g.171076  ORF Transcript_72728/g.171076 Transcript_72728/m.171076 type:complete len:225 (+) Transcript_72728:225-899(+)